MVGVVLTAARYFATHSVSPEAQATMWQVVSRFNDEQWSDYCRTTVASCARAAGVTTGIDKVTRTLRQRNLVSSVTVNGRSMVFLGDVFADLTPSVACNKSNIINISSSAANDSDKSLAVRVN